MTAVPGTGTLERADLPIVSRPDICRTRTAVLAALVIPLVLIAACDGSNGEGDDAKSTASARSTQSAAKPLTVAELDAASLVRKDVKGYTVRKLGKGEMAARDKVGADNEDCAALSRALYGVALGEPAAATYRRVTTEPDEEAVMDADTDEELEAALVVTTNTVTLASYGGPEGAEAALKSLSEGITACAGGFQFTATDEERKVTKVAEFTAPEAGDEAIAFTATVRQGGGEGPVKVVVFRKGTTLAYITTINAASLLGGKDFDFPADIVDAQAAKLG
jgi:predicted small secreted protein